MQEFWLTLRAEAQLRRDTAQVGGQDTTGPEHCGYAGRRVLVSRKWSGKTLADHRADRKAWLVETLGLELPDPARYHWAQVTPADPDYLPPGQRLLHVVAGRARWKAALTEARRRAGHPPETSRQPGGRREGGAGTGCEKPLGTGISWWSRLGESNPRPTHYEKPAKPFRACYLH
jgi:Replication initiator protein, pSAM2